MKLKFKTILDWITVTLLGLAVFSIPAFSFDSKLYILTWVFTGLLLICITISLIFFYQPKFSIITLSFMLFMLSALISNILNLFITFGTSIFLNTVILLFIYTYLISNRYNLKKMLIASYLGLCAFALYYIFSYFPELIVLNFDRLGAKFGDVNDICIILLIGLVLSLSMFFYTKKIFFIVANILMAIVFLLLSLTCGSKISLILSAIIILSFVALCIGKKRWYLTVIIFSAIVICFVIIINIPAFSVLKGRFLDMIYTFTGIRMGNVKVDNSTVERMDMFLNGISLFLRRPIFGFGQNGFLEFSTFHNGWSHNHISDSLCNYGLSGTFLYHFPLVLFFIKEKKTSKKESSPHLLLAILFVVSMISVALFRMKFFTYISPLVFASVKTRDVFAIDFFKRKIAKNK